MKKGLIQIIIPVYNAEKTLKKCLDSVQNQTFENWQALLVDDKSSDNSESIIGEYVKNDSRFLYIKHEKNSGASAARNTALARVDAEFVAFLDSDDFWEQNMLETLYDKAVKYDADIVQCRFIYDFTSGRQVLPTGAFKTSILLENEGLQKVYFKMMTGINMNHVCMKLIRTSLLGEIKFNRDLPIAEDLEFCVRLFANVKKYYFTDEILYHYCRNENSLTGKGLRIADKFKANRQVSRLIIKMLPVWGIDTVYYRVLATLRPYIIMVSKVYRIIREKVLVRMGERV